MPLYVYRCSDPECNHEREEFQHIHDDPKTICPLCHGDTLRRVPTRTHTSQREYDTPIQMHSIGLNGPEEIAEFKRRCPGVDVSADPNDELYGVPVARTRHQKLRALDAVGFEEKS